MPQNTSAGRRPLRHFNSLLSTFRSLLFHGKDLHSPGMTTLREPEFDKILCSVCCCEIEVLPLTNPSRCMKILHWVHVIIAWCLCECDWSLCELDRCTCCECLMPQLQPVGSKGFLLTRDSLALIQKKQTNIQCTSSAYSTSR